MIAFLARQKFRLDVGQGLASIISMGLLSVSAAPHIGGWLGISGMAAAAAILPGAILSVWLAGFIWEKVGGFREYQSQINRHNEILEKLDESLRK